MKHIEIEFENGDIYTVDLIDLAIMKAVENLTTHRKIENLSYLRQYHYITIKVKQPSYISIEVKKILVEWENNPDLVMEYIESFVWGSIANISKKVERERFDYCFYYKHAKKSIK